MDSFYLLSVERASGSGRLRAAADRRRLCPASTIDYSWGIGKTPFLMLMGRKDEMGEPARVEASYHQYIEGPTRSSSGTSKATKLTAIYVPDALAWIKKHL